MRSSPFFSHRNVRLCIWVIVPLLFAAPLRTFYHRACYPVSDVVINPVTGKYDPDLAAKLLPMVSAKEKRVEINIGCGSASDALFYLSPMLKTHPTATLFTVRYRIYCDGSKAAKDYIEEIVYNRESGQVDAYSPDFGKIRQTKSENVGSGIKDIAIHQMARQKKQFFHKASVCVAF